MEKMLFVDKETGELRACRNQVDAMREAIFYDVLDYTPLATPTDARAPKTLEQLVDEMVSQRLSQRMGYSENALEKVNWEEEFSNETEELDRLEVEDVLSDMFKKVDFQKHVVEEPVELPHIDTNKQVEAPSEGSSTDAKLEEVPDGEG